ncbi:hypothetical protein LJC59_05750 [Desulfovibrio sp. OttesenSCG-928-A18]|nr:hypothetical protein [Desulfovibrio sp. OttesenSCG-928-A18]
MRRVLEKMAKQLNSYDEASLMLLWQQYAEIVQDFEPTKRWEEAAIGLCLVQAVHWKNQLFNYNLALSSGPGDKSLLPSVPNFFSSRKSPAAAQEPVARKKATVLTFPGPEQNSAPADGKTEAGERGDEDEGRRPD